MKVDNFLPYILKDSEKESLRKWYSNHGNRLAPQLQGRCTWKTAFPQEHLSVNCSLLGVRAKDIKCTLTERKMSDIMDQIISDGVINTFVVSLLTVRLGVFETENT